MFALSIRSLHQTSIATLATLALASAATAQNLTAGSPISFSKEVLPILKNACVECHEPGGQGEEASGLDLQSYAGVMKGTRNGPMVIPGQSFTSNLMVLLDGRASPQIRMPYHRNPLRKVYIEIIRRWIDEGAKDN